MIESKSSLKYVHKMNKVEVQQIESTTQNTKFDYINNKCKNTYINKCTHSTKE